MAVVEVALRNQGIVSPNKMKAVTLLLELFQSSLQSCSVWLSGEMELATVFVAVNLRRSGGIQQGWAPMFDAGI